MLKIAIIDDGVGAVATYNKLKQVVSAQYTCKIISNCQLGTLCLKQLRLLAKTHLPTLLSQNDLVVLSSTALSFACSKQPEWKNAPVYFCDSPIMHACTYTVSNVLVVGDEVVTKHVKLPNVISIAMPKFSQLAQLGHEKDIVNYVSLVLENTETTFFAERQRFDCISLANSSMNLYKHCFRRVFPNIKIFDTLEGVARKLQRQHKKGGAVGESTVTFVDENGVDVTSTYQYMLDV